MKSFYVQLEDTIKKALHTLCPDKDYKFFLETTRNKKFGDLALSLPLKLASVIKKPPLEIASVLKEELERLFAEFNPGIDRIEIAEPGFVNFFLKDDTVKNLLMDFLKEGDKFFAEAVSIRERVLLEFVSANPTGPLSIAHGRQAVVGDVLANIFSFAGTEVTKEYYVNDEGTQIDLYVDTVKERIKEQKGENFRIPEKGYLGEYVKIIAIDTMNALKIKRVDVKDASAPADPGINSDKSNQEESIRECSLGVVISRIKSDLKSLGIVFDNWVYQRKDIICKGTVEEAIAFLKKKGLIYDKEDAVWFSSTDFGDDKDRVVRKRGGELTYFASDIAYHKNKIERGYDRLINLWGPDHHGYIPRVVAAIEALGFDKKFLQVIIIQLVNLKTKERMSKRRGTAVFLSDLVDQVGKDAARFYYLTRKNSSQLEFDIDMALAKNFDNPLYYIQYAHTRICSIINKYGAKLDFKNIELLKEKEEISLIKDILELRNVLETVKSGCEPFFIVEYLKNVANSFHKFYETHRVLNEQDASTTAARVLLITAVKNVLSLGLRLLGIEAPVSM